MESNRALKEVIQEDLNVQIKLEGFVLQEELEIIDEEEQEINNEEAQEVNDQEEVNQIEIISSTEESQLYELVPEPNTQDSMIEQTFSCCMCSVTFTDEIDLLEHCQSVHQIECLVNDHEDREFLCRNCGLEFETAEDLMVHKACDICLLTFHTDEKLDQHKEQWHTTPLKPSSPKKPKKSNSNNHQRMEKKEPKERKYRVPLNSLTPSAFPCCLCPTIFDFEADRLEHCESAHGFVFEPSMQLNPESPKCYFCDKSFSQLSSYYAHFEEPCKSRNRCNKCGRKFLHHHQLLQHDRNIHSSETPQYSCFKCSLSFHSSSAYYSHNHRYHSERIKYHCKICKKVFLTPSKLHEHLNIHQDIKSFMCEVCNKGFFRKDNLKNHMRLHSGEKPFACSYCNKTFSHQTDKRRHEYTHSGNYPFKCEKCGQGFSKIGSYEAHMRNGVEKCKARKEKEAAAASAAATTKKNEDDSSQDLYKVIFINQESNPDNLYNASDVIELDVMNEDTVQN